MWRNLILFAWAVGQGGFVRWMALSTGVILVALLTVLFFAVLGTM